MDPTLSPAPYMPSSFSNPSPFGIGGGQQQGMGMQQGMDPQQSMAQALAGSQIGQPTEPPWLGPANSGGPGPIAEQFGGHNPLGQEPGGFTSPQTPG